MDEFIDVSQWTCDMSVESQWVESMYPWMIQNPDWNVNPDPNMIQWIRNNDCLVTSCGGHDGHHCNSPGGTGLQEMRDNYLSFQSLAAYKPGHKYRIEKLESDELRLELDL